MQFLYPNVLFLMLIPVVLLMFLILTNKDSFQKYFSSEVLAKLSVKNKHMNKTTRNTLMFISLILMIISLSRPVANEKEHSFKQEVASIVIAVDVSKSMLATDIYPNRLTLAKKKVLELINNSKENALAVVVFAKSSFILSPITQDFNSLKILVENFDTGANFDNGSNIFSTLETTNKLLKDYENKNLLILSDGGNNSNFEKEIEYAKENKISIYTIALGKKEASPIKLQDGNFLTKKDGSIVTVSLNENIKELSFATNGGYINYTNSNQDIKEILKDINKKAVKKELESKKFKTYTELFYYPLALALLVLLISLSSLPSFKKKNIALSFLLSFIFSHENLNASIMDFRTIENANEAYENENYEKASKDYEKVLKTSESFYNLGNSLYKEGKYKEALSRYKNVTTANKDLEYQKLHNMGNTYAKLNDLENAVKMYEKALKLKEDEQTKQNLETVKNALKQKKKQENKEQKNNQNPKDKKEKKNKDKNSQENKKNKDKEKESKDKQNKKKEDSKKKESNSNKNQQNKDKNSEPKDVKKHQAKKNQISDLEERKWLESLKNKKTPVLLKKVDTKNEDTSSNPW